MHATIYKANMQQTSIPRTMKWLKISAEERYSIGRCTHHGLSAGLSPSLQYMGDETVLWILRERGNVRKKNDEKTSLSNRL